MCVFTLLIQRISLQRKKELNLNQNVKVWLPQSKSIYLIMKAVPSLYRVLTVAGLATAHLTIFNKLSAAPPVVSNIRASQRAGTHLVDIYYNVGDPDSPTVSVQVMVSADGGTTYNVPVSTFAGHSGAGVPIGNDRRIVWNAGVDWPGRFSSACRVRIIANDGSSPPAPSGMVYIPGGAFEMGDSFRQAPDELPVHSVFVSSFFMDKYEVTRELWTEVWAWAIGNGYQFSGASDNFGANHPIVRIFWEDAMKWCNARSEMENLTPAYYTDDTLTTIYKSGTATQSARTVKWSADGYRLPTEAEWEKGARGGLVGSAYPSGNAITPADARYGQSGTVPVGSFAPNGYGLYDMAGNVEEWCWDVYQSTWYAQDGARADDCRGPDGIGDRILRGGNWASSETQELRCSRRQNLAPELSNTQIGFRCVRVP